MQGSTLKGTTIGDHLQAARERDPYADKLLCVRTYCDNTDCAVREVDLFGKEFVTWGKIPDHLHCPACGREMIADAFKPPVVTLREQQEEEEYEARVSVNQQRKRAKKDGGFTIYGVADLLDDSLPE